MDEGFRCSWVERYDRKHEISAQQMAMNARLKSPATFCAEFQVKGRSISTSTILITANQFRPEDRSPPQAALSG